MMGVLWSIKITFMTSHTQIAFLFYLFIFVTYVLSLTPFKKSVCVGHMHTLIGSKY